jgi:DNA-directed RNA polymerase specialized sigma24 family protein
MRDVLEGTPSALAALVERTAPVLYPLALRITGAPERASRVLEELFDEVWRDRGALRAAHGLPLTAMIRRCRDLSLAQAGHANGGDSARLEPRRPMSAAAGAVPAVTAAAPAGAASTPAASALVGEDIGPFVSRQTACEALGALPARDRIALEEAFFCGTHAREIAIMMGASTSDAEAILRSALVRFRNHIQAPDEVQAGTGTEG